VTRMHRHSASGMCASGYGSACQKSRRTRPGPFVLEFRGRNRSLEGFSRIFPSLVFLCRDLEADRSTTSSVRGRRTQTRQLIREGCDGILLRRQDSPALGQTCVRTSKGDENALPRLVERKKGRMRGGLPHIRYTRRASPAAGG